MTFCHALFDILQSLCDITSSAQHGLAHGDADMHLDFTAYPDLAARIRAGAIAERDRRNEISGTADRLDLIADKAAALCEQCRDLAGSVRGQVLAVSL